MAGTYNLEVFFFNSFLILKFTHYTPKPNRAQIKTKMSPNLALSSAATPPIIVQIKTRHVEREKKKWSPMQGTILTKLYFLY